MQVQAKPAAAPRATAGQEAGGQAPANDARATSLVEKLRDPKIREKLEKILGPELLQKLDRIFNAAQPGFIPEHVKKAEADRIAEILKGRQAGAQPPAGAQAPQGPAQPGG